MADLWQTLAAFGLLWVGGADPELHMVVIDGIEGDATRVFGVDPWPIGLGQRQPPTFRERMRNYQAASTLAGLEAQVAGGAVHRGNGVAVGPGVEVR